MKKKSFDRYIQKRLTSEEIIDIERKAMLEKQALQTLQKDVAQAMRNYMNDEKIGFNELVRRLGASPTHVAKIQRGETNLTLASIARVFALLDRTPHLVFGEKK